RLDIGGPGGAGGLGRAGGAAPGRGAPAGTGAATSPAPGARPVLTAAGGRPGAPAGPALFGAPTGPPPPPVILSRDGKQYNLTRTNVRAGTEIKLTTARPTLDLRLTELDRGSWVIFQLPGFTTAASGTREDSLDALRKANETSYYKAKDALWVKVVSNGSGASPPYGGGLGGPDAAANSVKVSR